MPSTTSNPEQRSRRTAAAIAALALGAVLVVPGVSALGAGTEDGPNPNATTPAPLTLGSSTIPATATTATPASSGYGSASSTPAAAGAAPTYESGKALIAASDWKGAIAVLNAVTAAEPGNADAWNLLGYATRKNGDPKAAIPLYAKALALNPRHRGALEYQGEAFVETRNLTRARANLAALKRICGTRCEEYRDLAAAIAKAGKAK